MSVTFLTSEDEKAFVKSINGVKPDPETGDVAISSSGGNADQSASGDMFDGYDRFYDSIARMQVNPTEPLNIETYDGSNQPTHPKVLYFKDGWNGYKYWLTYTPFPSNNNGYENPCIAYSNDGINFIKDAMNPIENTPMEDGTKVGYNSDAHIVMVGNVMECWWRTHFQSGTNADHEVIFRKTSVDGINWSEKEELFRVQDASAGSCLSPAVIFEDGIYKIWTVYKQQVMRYYESTTGKDWVYIRDINVDNPDYPTYKVWHIDVIHTEKGYEFVGCYHPTNDYNDNKYIYYAVSEDNITYSTRVLILTPGKTGNFDATELYRPAILRMDNKVQIHYGCRNGWGNWRIGMIEAPNPYLFNAVLKNGLRFDSLESRVSALESGSGGDSGETTTFYSITYKLTNCTSSNGSTSVSEGASYTTQLNTTTGYTMGDPTITMGGVDITATAWNKASATISIPSVTGNVSITCVATADSSGDDYEDSGFDDMVVVDSFEESAWRNGFFNDKGQYVEKDVAIGDMNMSDYIRIQPVQDVFTTSKVTSTAKYLRISYFDSEFNWIKGQFSYENTATFSVQPQPENAVYYVISCSGNRNKDVITVERTTIEYTGGNLMEGVTWTIGQLLVASGSIENKSGYLYSSGFNVASLIGAEIALMSSISQYTGARMCFYDVSGGYISESGVFGDTKAYGYIPENAYTAKVSVPSGATCQIMLNTKVIGEATATA